MGQNDQSISVIFLQTQTQAKTLAYAGFHATGVLRGAE